MEECSYIEEDICQHDSDDRDSCHYVDHPQCKTVSESICDGFVPLLHHPEKRRSPDAEKQQLDSTEEVVQSKELLPSRLHMLKVRAKRSKGLPHSLQEPHCYEQQKEVCKVIKKKVGLCCYNCTNVWDHLLWMQGGMS